MQFTSTIIVALLVVSTVTADQKSYNLRSGRKLQEETDPNLHDLGACNGHLIMNNYDPSFCTIIHNVYSSWSYLMCDEAGKTCTKDNSHLIQGDHCTIICEGENIN